MWCHLKKQNFADFAYFFLILWLGTDFLVNYVSGTIITSMLDDVNV